MSRIEHKSRRLDNFIPHLLLGSLLLLASGCGANPFRVSPNTAPSRVGAPTAPVVVVTATAEATAGSESPTSMPTNVAVPTLTLTTPPPSVTPPVLEPATIPTSGPLPTSNAGALFTRVKIFLIAVDDGGKSGPKIGCNDSVVAVTRAIAPTGAPLTAALKDLLSLHTRLYGQSGLYNALYQSNLQVSRVTLLNGKATIQLTGTLSLGGECDDPRVEAQITNTALQFSTVKAVDVYVNGKPLKNLLGGKGP